MRLFGDQICERRRTRCPWCGAPDLRRRATDWGSIRTQERVHAPKGRHWNNAGSRPFQEGHDVAVGPYFAEKGRYMLFMNLGGAGLNFLRRR